MGSPQGQDFRKYNEEQHWVEISRPFLMSESEVTQGQYFNVTKEKPMADRKTVLNNPCNICGLGNEYPVYCISWFEAIEFCNILSEIESLEPVYKVCESEILWDTTSTGYRLPTEAEWEYAARAGTTNTYYKYDNEFKSLENYSWYRNNAGSKTHIVKTKYPNDWGFYDMQGNVWEWVWDWYEPFNSSFIINPKGPANGKTKVWRGGSWICETSRMRIANRWQMEPKIIAGDLGFRIVRNY